MALWEAVISSVKQEKKDAKHLWNSSGEGYGAGKFMFEIC